MSRPIALFALSLSLLISFVNGPAHAQSSNAVAKAFAGSWISYDRNFSAQSNCLLNFSATKQGDFYPIKPSNCRGDIANVAGWKIQNNQLVFVAADMASLAIVGGNQERLSGSIINSKIPVIFEKLEMAKKIVRARKAISCSYVGYSNKCATPRQFAPPPTSIGAEAKLKVLVNLNARIEPRNNAKVASVLKPNSCVTASFCTLASDGLWCKIKSNETEAWIKKQAVRQKKWPIITFENGC